MTFWHALDTEVVFDQLQSGPSGLSREEAALRLARYGPNEISAEKRVGALSLLLAQFKNFLILLLMAAALISIFVGLWEDSVQEIVEAGLILLIVLFIVLVGFYQEYNARAELAALKNMLTPEAVVERAGDKIRIPARELVPGDLIHIEAGDRLPADARLIEAIQLKADESVLTGEAEPVTKKTGILPEEAWIGDRLNMVFMGSTLTQGKGRALVAATGMETEFGRIAGQIRDIKEEKTPLQNRLDTLGRQIGLGVIGLCILVFLGGLWMNQTPVLEMFLIAVALAVAAVPEGLPGVVTVALAMGTRRMVKKNVIVKALPAVETLGCTTVICSDKTGTITHNQMTVKKIYLQGKMIEVQGEGYLPRGGFIHEGDWVEPGDDPVLRDLLTGAALCNNASLRPDNGAIKTTGDPTEISLLVAAAKAGLVQAEANRQYPRVGEIPFSSERKRMTTIHRNGEDFTAFIKGAPDLLAGISSHIRKASGIVPFTAEEKKRLLAVNETLAGDAFRVLGLASKKFDHEPLAGEVEDDLVFVGLLAMIDPPRDDARTAMEKCLAAGIRTVMITGDHQATAVAVGRQVGLQAEDSQVMTGAQLSRLSDDELRARVDTINIYARVSPEHKLRIVSALQDKGHVVAMTGDGVNDAPALRKADIGVAMGLTGTDVSKQAADMVLTDDNFASIVGAVEEGRGIYDNIRKTFAYLISGNIVEVALVFITSIWGAVPVALTATQILIINLVSDGLPALALSVDPFEPKAMERPPRSREEPLHHNLAPFIVYYPIIVTIVALGLFYRVYDPGVGNGVAAQTAAFLTIVFAETFQSFAARSLRYSSFKVGLLANKWLAAAALGSLIVALGLVYLPLNLPFMDTPLGEVVSLTPLDPLTALGVFGLSATGFVYLELAKTLKRKEK